MFDFTKQPGLVRNPKAIGKIEPLISIITPFFNAGTYFEQTFCCVMNQTFIWYEWIIVDDGSTNTEDLEILQSFAERDERIKVYHKENGGPAAARNYAIARTNTDLIVSLDADDLIEPVYLEQTYFALYFHPEAAWAYTDSLGFQEMEYVWQVPFDSEKLKKRNFLIEIGTFRKEAFLQAGGYDDAQRYSHEDWNLWLRFLAQGGFPVHISSLSSWYRIVKNGALHKTNDNQALKKRAYKRIAEVAKKIKEPVRAIEYPRIAAAVCLHEPKVADWSYQKEKRQKEVLLLYEEKDENSLGALLQLLEKLKTADIQMGIMITGEVKRSYIHVFREFTEQVYELPCFLDLSDYAEFISYYIKSRQVDGLVLDESEYGYCLLPWLKKHFPKLYVAEFSEDKKNASEEVLSNIMREQNSDISAAYLKFHIQHIEKEAQMLRKTENLYFKIHPIEYMKKKIKSWIKKKQY